MVKSSAAAPARPETQVRKADLIEGLLTGLAAITAFNEAQPRMTPTELAMQLGVSRAAARRHLITLCYAGYAATDGKHYWLTPRVLALGRSYSVSARLPRIVRPLLQQVTAETGESSNLALLEGYDVVYPASADVARLISSVIAPGTRLPAHTTAAGRVILAGLNRGEFEQWLSRADLAAYTQYTVTSKRAFAAEVAQARAEGHSAIEGHFEVGLRGIAVPLLRMDGSTAGALGISMPTATTSLKEATRRCLPALKAAAAALRELL